MGRGVSVAHPSPVPWGIGNDRMMPPPDSDQGVFVTEPGSRMVPDLEHARKERTEWYYHLLLFVVVQTIVQLMLWFTPIEAVDLKVFGPDPEKAARRLSYVRNLWFVILIVDFVWSFSYTWWRPRMKPASGEGEEKANR